MNNPDLAALESMEKALNYNTYIFNKIQSYIKKGKVLDFGAGYGNFADYLVNQSIFVDVLEVDSNAKKILQKKGHNLVENIDSVFKNYSTITSLNVLEHVDKDIALIKDIYENMSKDSLLILYLPASMKIWSDLDVLVNHYRRYEMKPMLNNLKEIGFKILNYEYVDTVGYLTLRILKFLRLKPKFNKELIIIYDKFIFKFFKFLDIIFNQKFGKNIFIVLEK